MDQDCLAGSQGLADGPYLSLMSPALVPIVTEWTPGCPSVMTRPGTLASKEAISAVTGPITTSVMLVEETRCAATAALGWSVGPRHWMKKGGAPVRAFQRGRRGATPGDAISPYASSPTDQAELMGNRLDVLGAGTALPAPGWWFVAESPIARQSRFRTRAGSDRFSDRGGRVSRRNSSDCVATTRRVLANCELRIAEAAAGSPSPSGTPPTGGKRPDLFYLPGSVQFSGGYGAALPDR